MGKIIGIDLGTTNCCVAVLEGGTVQIVPNKEGGRTTPTVVGFTDKGERLVGQIAKRQAVTNASNTVYAVKRLIGRKFNSPESQRTRESAAFEIVDSQNGDARIRVQGRTYSPPEISGIVLQRLKTAAEDFLGEAVTDAIVTVPAYFDDTQRQATKDAGKIAGLKVERIINELTREQFESLVAELVEQTIEPCQKALWDAKLQPTDIDKVILVGGQTRSPIVARTVHEIFGKEASAEINPDEVVAMGAAIQGAVLAGDVKDIVLLDILPLSLGLETRGGLFTKIIERNSTIPLRNSLTFTTVVDNQSSVEIHVLQGEREIAEGNRSLGKFELVGIPANPRGVPQIEVSFEVDANGIVSVSAKDKATGREQQMRITPTSGLSTDEINRLITEAESSLDTDRRVREVIGLRNKLDTLARTTRRAFTEFGGLLSSEDRKNGQQALNHAEELADSEDVEELKRVMDNVPILANNLNKAMISSSGNEAE